MRCFLVGISGYSRTGKDTAAHRLVERFNAIHLGMTDHAKRHMADVYKFSEEQLFGPSEFRNAGDLRYPKPVYFGNKCHRIGKIPEKDMPKVSHGGAVAEKITLDPNKVYYICEGRGPKNTEKLLYTPLRLGAARYFIEEGDPAFWLSPREALQQYCELLEKLYLGSLIDYAVQTHLRLVPTTDPGFPKAFFSSFDYDRMKGFVERSIPQMHEGHFITCFSDFRRKHQIQGAKDAASRKLTPVIIRVKHPDIKKPPFKHISETEQATIPDSAFDFVVDNDGSIDDLNMKMDSVVNTFTMDDWR